MIPRCDGVVDKMMRTKKITDIAKPVDVGVKDKEVEEIEKYKSPKDEAAQIWKMKKVTMKQIVAGTLES